MRLLNAQTQGLHTFVEINTPAYAILSHTWGDEEVTLHDLQHGSYSALKAKAGWDKIQHCCQQAMHDGLAWVWIDTCCIDKTSSAELQEALNSMFRYYEMATECYVHLFDVAVWTKQLAKARWFRRGWTLQELLAPGSVRFFDAAWVEFGDKISMRQLLSSITGISEEIILGSVIGVREAIDAVSVAQRMSWAARRETTRVEDLAYCLLGIFDVSLPLLYGEGPKAFYRLQVEIIKMSDDQSILAWGAGRETSCMWGVSPALAQTPADFMGCGDMISWGAASPGDSFCMTQRGLQLNLPIVASLYGGDLLYCILSCTTKQMVSDAGARVLAVPLLGGPHRPRASRLRLGEDWRNRTDVYDRLSLRMPIWVDEKDLITAPRQCLHVPKVLKHGTSTWPRLHMGMQFSGVAESGYFVMGAYPPERSENKLVDVGALSKNPSNVVMVHFGRCGKPGFVLAVDYTGASVFDTGLPDDNDIDGAQGILSINDSEAVDVATEIVNVTAKVRTIIALEVGIPASDIKDTDNLSDLGVDSLMSLSICGRIREDLDLDFPTSILEGATTVGAVLQKMRFATRPNLKLSANKIVRHSLRIPAAPQITLMGVPRFAIAELASDESLVGFLADEPRWRQLSYTSGPVFRTTVLQSSINLVAEIRTRAKTHQLVAELQSIMGGDDRLRQDVVGDEQALIERHFQISGNPLDEDADSVYSTSSTSELRVHHEASGGIAKRRKVGQYELYPTPNR